MPLPSSKRLRTVWGHVAFLGTLALAYVITYNTGGTTNAFPHLFYIPVILAAFLYGIAGGIVAGVAAGILCGPLMPHDVAAGIAQSWQNWLLRMIFFTAVGGLTGSLIGSLQHRIAALADLNEQTIRAFVQAIDAKDHHTAKHSTRVAAFAEAIAKEMKLPPADVERIRRAALLHDVGKIAVPEAILTKPGRLTTEEWHIVQQHPVESAKIISGVDQYSPYIAGVRYHHERLDGKGYPDGLSGDKIPLDARIIAVADALEAMTADRAYRPRLSLDEALRELQEGKGTQFDPEVVDACERALRRGMAEDVPPVPSKRAM